MGKSTETGQKFLVNMHQFCKVDIHVLSQAVDSSSQKCRLSKAWPVTSDLSPSSLL